MGCVTLNCNSISNNKQNINHKDNRFIRNTLIREVAFESLKEMLISFALTGISCLFVATPAIPGLVIFTISILAINTLIRSLTAQQAYALHLIKQRKHKPSEVKPFELTIRLLQLICPWNFSILHVITSNVIIHEAGHAAAVLTVLQNSNPKVEVFPFTGGETRYNYSPLSSIGNYLGLQGSKALISAAGTGLGIISAAAMIGLSHHFKEDHPRLSLYLLCSGIMTIAQHVLYALSALWETSPVAGHDFVSLWKYGINPLASAICIVALPIFVKLTLFAIDQYRNRTAS